MAAEGTTVKPSRAAGVEHGSMWADLDQVLERVPSLTGRPRSVTALPGGLTNRNSRVRTADGADVVVRLSSPQSALLAIDRDAEHHNTAAAARAGVAPDVVGYLPDLRALIIRWVDGHTTTEQSLDDSVALAAVARLCRQLHEGPRFQGDFDMFALQHRYLQVCQEGGFRLPAGYLDFMPQADAARTALAATAGPTVPCHNDLLPGNILDDGERLWFIDFEYAGNGDPCFELGNICSEAHLGPDRLEELVTAYYGEPSPGRTARAALLAVMSNYGWTLWAAIQAATSEVTFDFWSWGMEKYDRAVEQFRDPGFARLMMEVDDRA